MSVSPRPQFALIFPGDVRAHGRTRRGYVRKYDQYLGIRYLGLHLITSRCACLCALFLRSCSSKQIQACKYILDILLAVEVLYP